MALRNVTGATYWVLDRNGGHKVLVTPDNRQLYSNSIRYIRLDAEPVPNDTQEILGLLEKQYADGIAREDFTEEQIERAADGMTGRRFHRTEQAESKQTLPADLVPPAHATAAPVAQKTPEKVTLAEGEATVPKKKASKKKAAG